MTSIMDEDEVAGFIVWFVRVIIDIGIEKHTVAVCDGTGICVFQYQCLVSLHAAKIK